MSDKSKVTSSATDPASSLPPPATGKLALSPFWRERLDSVPPAREAAPARRIIPQSPASYREKLTVVADAPAAERMLDFAQQRAITFIGIDCEFRYRRPGVVMKWLHGKPLVWDDPRSVVPLLMSVVLTEPQAQGHVAHYPFVIDLRTPDVLSPLASLLRMPAPFVAHYVRTELFCIWQLGLPTPSTIWDTWVAEKAFCLGRHHPRYKKAADEIEEARAKDEAEDVNEAACGLAATCLRYGVAHPFLKEKTQLQQSFLDHGDQEPFTATQLQYASADAVAAAGLYQQQVVKATRKNALTHLMNVEMPWAITNARMVWDGVRVAPEELQALREACDRNAARLSKELRILGLSNVRSPIQMKRFMDHLGLLEYFRQGRGYSFDDKHLEAVQGRHDAVAKIRELRKMLRLRSDKILTGELIGDDGRLHPDHRQLGAHSSRNAMRWPNIGGIGQALRPLVVPEANMAIGEVDLAQIEVGIAGAVYGDRQLIDMFNSGDVYCGMARLYYREQLLPDQLAMSDHNFKRKFKSYRGQMKVFTLAIIYNITPIGLAAQLGITTAAAAQERAKFLSLFPVLAESLRAASDYGAIRGFASLCDGLRRYRAYSGHPSTWEVNWMRNTPVQGSAAVVFKVAGNRLFQRYQHYGAKIIIPLHDAFTFEAPKQHLHEVAKITAEVMRSTVQEFFPQLNPSVEINIDHPECWNKDGKHRSLGLWMINPSTCKKYLKS
jgi:DNA polymerase-1